MPDHALRVVPETASKALGLIRVSKERDGMVSPEIQRAAITDHAARAGYEITGWLEGIDESGSQARSSWWARLDQAVVAVEAGEYDVVLVWKFSRVARQRLRWAVAIDRVESAGGRLESATEAVDVTTSTGRFTRGMLAELQAFEAERIGETWKEAHARRVAAGRPATGKPKWGYAYDPVEKLHQPDPQTGPVLAGLYARYIAGESVYQLVRWLNSHGWRTTRGGAWTTHSLRRVLDTGFGAGIFLSHGEVHQGVHEPVIDAGTWQAYQDAREQRRALTSGNQHSTYLLSGMIRCARCGGPMTAGQFGTGRRPKYRCANGVQKGPTACIGGYVMAPYVEAEVFGWLRAQASEVDGEATTAAADAEAELRRMAAENDEVRLTRAHAKAADAIKRAALNQATAPIPTAIYRENIATLTAEETRLRAALEQVQRRRRAQVPVPTRVTANLIADWGELETTDRRAVLRTLVDTVLVRTGRPRAWVDVIPTWADFPLPATDR